MKEKIDLTHEQLNDLWEVIYHKGNKYTLNDEIYEQIEKINTSEYSDGESFDYIIKRESDGKFFKFNVWDSGRSGYIFEDKYIIEVEEINKKAYK